jgi:adenine-specific DNA-methyltransferase
VVETIQDSYCGGSEKEYRRAAGQFFTPRWIAAGLARWALGCQPKRIVDPAAGFGILLDECRQQGFGGELVGYEIDESIVSRARHLYTEELNAQLRHANYLLALPEPIEAAVVNPPYNRFQNRELNATVKAEIASAGGLAASGFTNQYALFIYLIVSRLQPEGRAAFIVPSEFLATGYGAQVKAFIARSGRLAKLILFDTSERVFPEAATTACVLLFDGRRHDSLGVWHLRGIADAQAFYALCGEEHSESPGHMVRIADLDPTANWQGLGLDLPTFSGVARLDAFGKVKRGIATGANEYFVLRPSEARTHRLPTANLVPCIASASSASSTQFDEASWMELAAADRPCYLFDGMAKGGDEVERYLARGTALGIHQRYLTRMRKPWYRLEGRRPAALLLAVFGRDGFRVCLNRSHALNLTAFHGFYPSPGFEHFVPLLWLYLQGASAKATFGAQQRSYGDGLKKLEPGDWGKLLVPDWSRWNQQELDAAIELALCAVSQGEGDALRASSAALDAMARSAAQGQSLEAAQEQVLLF